MSGDAQNKRSPEDQFDVMRHDSQRTKGAGRDGDDQTIPDLVGFRCPKRHR